MTLRLSPASCFLLLLLSLITGCASLTSEYDPPKVTMESFRSLSGQSGAPRFEIVLRIVNPNKQSLDIAGISYGVELLGRELVTGVTKEIPLIEGYSEETVTLEAGIQLFQLVRLLASLGTNTATALEYKFSAKIDFNGFTPTQRLSETGEIKLN